MKLIAEEHEETIFCLTISLHFLPDRGKRIQALVETDFSISRVWIAYGAPNRKVMHLRFRGEESRKAFKKRAESAYNPPDIQAQEAFEESE